MSQRSVRMTTVASGLAAGISGGLASVIQQGVGNAVGGSILGVLLGGIAGAYITVLLDLYRQWLVARTDNRLKTGNTFSDDAA